MLDSFVKTGKPMFETQNKTSHNDVVEEKANQIRGLRIRFGQSIFKIGDNPALRGPLGGSHALKTRWTSRTVVDTISYNFIETMFSQQQLFITKCFLIKNIGQ